MGIDVHVLEEMLEAISRDEFPLTHAVLIARRGELAVEAYFHGFDRGTLHVVPQIDLVTVITSGNYRGGLTITRQPQRLFRQYILPSVSFRP